MPLRSGIHVIDPAHRRVARVVDPVDAGWDDLDDVGDDDILEEVAIPLPPPLPKRR